MSDSPGDMLFGERAILRGEVARFFEELRGGGAERVLPLARGFGRTLRGGRELSDPEALRLLRAIDHTFRAMPTVDAVAETVKSFLDELAAPPPPRTRPRFALFLVEDVVARSAPAPRIAPPAAPAPRVPIATIVVDGGRAVSLDVPAGALNPAAVNAAIAELGLEGSIHCPTAEEIATRRRGGRGGTRRRLRMLPTATDRARRKELERLRRERRER